MVAGEDRGGTPVVEVLVVGVCGQLGFAGPGNWFGRSGLAGGTMDCRNHFDMRRQALVVGAEPEEVLVAGTPLACHCC